MPPWCPGLVARASVYPLSGRPQVVVDKVAVQERVSNLSPITVTFHRPVIRAEAVVLPPSPLDPFQELRATVRSAMIDILGTDAVPETAEGYELHVSLA